MTKYFFTKVLTTYFLNLVLFFSFFSVAAQNSDPPRPYLNPKFGPDSISRIQCANNLSNMAEYMKIDLPDYALAPWKLVFENAPEARENIYIIGAKIYQHLLSQTEDPQIRAGLFDTLMLIYDRRIQYFGNEGYVLGRKGVDIIRYNEKDYQNAYEAFSNSARLGGSETSLNVITGLAQTASVMFNNGLIEEEEFLSKYFVCQDILAEKRKAGKSIPSIRRAENMLDRILENSNFKDCEPLETFFAEKISNDESNEELMQLTIDLLTSSGCENTAFCANVNDMLLKISPDAGIAYKVAKFNINNENYEKAAEYLIMAIEIEEKADRKALYQYQLSLIYLGKLSNPKEARFYAKKASQSKTNWGDPYFVIAAASVEGIKSCNVDAFEKQAIHWLAVDYCIKAKSVDPSITVKANDLIAQYKSSFPNVEETFFRSLHEGDEFSFNCWIDESTRVKTR
ncbi:MAG: hypothetical protein KAS71_14455 [Bacteroidales bacterium]|nr:hypothetical protein [Bacteroidales bacterium]